MLTNTCQPPFFQSIQNQLIDMMSIGTLLAYTIVGVCVIVLRYQEDETTQHNLCILSTNKQIVARQLVNANFSKQPTRLTASIANFSLIVFCLVTIITCVVFDFGSEQHTPWGASFTLVLCAITLMFISVIFIARQPQNKFDLTFSVPLVPFTPLVSIFLNMYLMFQLDTHTWIRFGIWLVIGYVIFFTYSIRSSVEGKRINIELSAHGDSNKVTCQANDELNGRSNMAFISDTNTTPK